jgi:hypothetical protein
MPSSLLEVDLGSNGSSYLLIPDTFLCLSVHSIFVPSHFSSSTSSPLVDLIKSSIPLPTSPPAKNGAPHILVLASSGQRCADLVRELRALTPGGAAEAGDGAAAGKGKAGGKGKAAAGKKGKGTGEIAKVRWLGSLLPICTRLGSKRVEMLIVRSRIVYFSCSLSTSRSPNTSPTSPTRRSRWPSERLTESPNSFEPVCPSSHFISALSLFFSVP